MPSHYQVERFSEIYRQELAQAREQIRMANAVRREPDSDHQPIYAAIRGAMVAVLVSAGRGLQTHYRNIRQAYSDSEASVHSVSSTAE